MSVDCPEITSVSNGGLLDRTADSLCHGMGKRGSSFKVLVSRLLFTDPVSSLYRVALLSVGEPTLLFGGVLESLGGVGPCVLGMTS